MKRIHIWLLALMLVFPSLAQAAVTEEFAVSNGVTYTEIVEEGTVPQSVRVMEIDTKDPYTKVEAGVPDPLNKLVQTSKQALAASEEGHEVVGAINGSFFNREPMPLYFVAIDQYLVNGGMVEASKDEFVSEMIAFGMNKAGKGQIDHYSTDFTYSHNGAEGTMAGHNGQRHPNSTMVYTPNFSSGVTTTNAYGYEVLVAGVEDPSLRFGESLTGKVVGFRPYGQAAGAVIPKDGFVLSAHGTEAEALRQMKLGDSVSVSVNVDEKWQGADFMIGSGPMLVKDSKVALSMNPNSAKAREKAPRTAVAIDKTGDKVAFITVDGRQPGYSTGMSLSEFASYIQSLGYDRALNMDGGGSTTMLAREPGDFTATIQNKPSDPWGERPVSTFLMAITTAPKGVPTTINASLSTSGPLEIGESATVTISSILDEFGNPVKLDNVAITSDLGTVAGTVFTASKAGSGFISVKKGAAEVKLPITVKEEERLFSDVPNDFRAADDIASLVSQDIISGYPDGTFKPQETLTRVQAAIMLQRALKLPVDEVKNPGFSDVPETYRSYGSIAAVTEAGVMFGRTDGTFDPQAQLTRAEMAAVLHRAFKLPAAETNIFSDNYAGTFAYSSVNALAAAGITQGFPDGTFRPSENITRADFSIFLNRAN